MTLFGLDPSAGWLLLGGSVLVLIAGIIIGLLIPRTDERYEATLLEKRRLAYALGVANERNRQLRRQLHAGADLTAVLEVSDAR